MKTLCKPKAISSQFLVYCCLLLTVLPDVVQAAGLPAVTVTGSGSGQTFSLSLQILLLMTGLTLLPSALTMMTAFTRIIIVLGILRQAMGMNQTPSNQILIGMALFMTVFVMMPVFTTIYNNAVQPYVADQISGPQALTRATAPLRTFMLNQTREADLTLFADMAKTKLEDPSKVPMSILIPAYVSSELKTAFQIGFLLFIPFLIIDLVVASVLMAMGMIMLSPMIISLPFKIMLFVLVDGWSLTLGTLASSFYV
ncbi:MAG TPA: flagellar biosynthesis protein FliP [Gammaproteobacteria bacterium]|nr:flagellar biosynthesis protein FliP [Gammaproteobacteria bacterium]